MFRLLFVLPLFYGYSLAASNRCNDLSSVVDIQLCQSLESNTLFPRLTNGISANLCNGYAEKDNTCWNGDFYKKTLTDSQYLTRKDHYWQDHEIKAHCQSQSTLLNIGSQERVASISYEDLVTWDVCYDRDWKKRCVKSRKKHSFPVFIKSTQENILRPDRAERYLI